MECDTDDHSFMAFYFEVNIPEDIAQAIVKESEHTISGKPDVIANAIVQGKLRLIVAVLAARIKKEKIQSSICHV